LNEQINDMTVVACCVENDVISLFFFQQNRAAKICLRAYRAYKLFTATVLLY